MVSYIVQYDGTEKIVSAPEGVGPVNLTVSSLTPGTAYSFTLFTVFENIRSRGESIIAVTAPGNPEGFRSTGQNEASIILQWLNTNSTVSYIVQYDGTEKIVSAPEGIGPVNLTVSSLSPGTAYLFTLFTVFENIRSRGVSIIAVTAPLNAEGFRSTGQNETSVTLQWLHSNNTFSYIVQYDGTEKNVSAPEGVGPVNLIISSLSPGTAYSFTLLAVFENRRSSAESIIAVTAPLNAEEFRSTGQNETSVTLQWLHSNSMVSYIVQYDGTEKIVSAPEGIGPVNLTVSSLSPGTAYLYTLFAVFENIRSSGVSIIAVTAPLNAEGFRSTGQTETSVTLQWLHSNSMDSYTVQYDGTEKNVSAPEGVGPVNLTVSSLSPGTAYSFTLLAVFKNRRSSGESIIAVTAPVNAEEFRSTGQNETSVTLQWLHSNSMVSYIVQYDGTEKIVSAPEGVGPVNLTVSSLTPGTAYSFTLFIVFENIRSRGESIIAVTAPLNAEEFRSTGQNETSVTLQWLHSNSMVSYIVQYDGTEKIVSAPEGIGPVNLTVSSLSPGTAYLYTLFAVFENIRSSGVSIIAVTAPLNAEGFRSTGQNETSVTLQWLHSNNTFSYIVQYDGTEKNVSAPEGVGPVNLIISSLSPGTAYSFTLLAVFENRRSSAESIIAVTAPLNAEEFRSTGQNETSVTLQWLHSNSMVSYIVQYDGTEKIVSAPEGIGPVNLTVSSLSPGTAYVFTLFAVFENISSSGVSIIAITAPVNAEEFRSTGQNETSVTLQWLHSNSMVSYIVQYDGTEKIVSAPEGVGPVNLTVSSLTPGTAYSFTLFTVFENIRSRGESIIAVTAPGNPEGFRSTGQNEASIILQWLNTNSTVSYIVQYDGTEKIVSAPEGIGPVNLTVSSLSPGTAYLFTLFTVFENIRSRGVSIIAVTAPLNAEGFRSTGQNETSVTLQWLHSNNTFSYIVQYDGTEKNVSAPEGVGPVNLIISSLSPGTAYSFTLLAVFENRRSSAESIIAVTAPLNAEEFRSTGQNETSVTLQWLHSNSMVSYIVQYDGTEKIVSAPEGIGPVNLTVSSLSSGTAYVFTLFAVFENISSSGVSIIAITAPLNAEGFRSTGQNETSITLQWLHSNSTVSYIVQYDGTEKIVSAPEGVGPVNLTVSSLTPGTAYSFTLFTVFENIRSRGESIITVTAPGNPEGFRSTGQNETSIILQWLNTNSTVSYIVQYDGTEKIVSAPEGIGPVNLTVSSLSPGTAYLFTLFTVFENIRSRGVSIIAVTAPLNAEEFRSTGQNETSVTLQWLHSNSMVSYIVQYDGTEKIVSAPEGIGPVNLTVSSLSPGTAYLYTLFAVFENIRSSGVSIIAVTAPLNAEGFRSTGQNETSVTLQWLHSNNTFSYIVQYDGTEKNVSAPEGVGPVNLIISSLSPGTAYSFTLLAVFENRRSSAESIIAVTAPLNAEEFRSTGQNETSVTLQWLHSNSMVSYIVQYDGTEKIVSAPEGIGPVNLTVSSLSPGTAYVFTLFAVFENISSSGVSIIAITAPLNAEGFRSTGQNETSITLQWLHSNSTVSYIVQYDGTEKIVSAPEGVGPVNLTVSSLTPGTAYSFSLFTVFENIRSRGESIITVTAPLNAEGFRSTGQTETSVTLQWLHSNSTDSYTVQYDGTEKNVSAPEGVGPVNLTVSSLSPGTAYSFTLLAVFKNRQSSGESIIAVTAPVNAEEFRSTGQNETSVTLQWLHSNSMVSYIVQYDGTEKIVSAPEGVGPVNLTVSSLTPGTAYSFTLFTVFENIRSRGESIIAVTAPGNPEGFRSTGQNEASIILQWLNTNSMVSYIVQYDGTEKIVSAPEGIGPVNLTVSSLSPGTAYLFTLFTVFENIRSRGVSIIAVTAPLNAEGFRSTGQNETSITLQWLHTNITVNYIVQYDGTEKSVSAPEGVGPVNLTVSSLTPGTAYSFTLFTVFKNIRSRGQSIIAVTAPLNAEEFRSTGQNETSVTLQWLHSNSMVSYIVQYDGTEKIVSAPEGIGPVNLTVSSLSPGTAYVFTLFAVFENISSSGVSIIAITAPLNAEGFRSTRQNETSITLQWLHTNSTVSFIVQYDGTEKNVSAPDGVGPVNLTVSSLTPGTAYSFTLFTVFENIRSRGESIIAVTAPGDLQGFRPKGQNEMSITLQWLHTNGLVSYIVQYDGTEKNVSAPEGFGPVNLTVSSLSPGTAYLFTLFTVFENIRIGGVSIIAVTAPLNAEGFRSTGQNETSITLQWFNTNSTVSYIVQYDGTEKNVSAPDVVGPVNLTISSLSPGTPYSFTLFTVFENIRSSGVSIIAVTDFRLIRQNETSITLQWCLINKPVTYVVQYDGRQRTIILSGGTGLINVTISALTPETKYSFTLCTVFENIKSCGRSITAVTVPLNAEDFRSVGQNETSITLQWLNRNRTVSYIIQYDGSEKNINVPDGTGPIILTVPSLTPENKYSFTIFAVFENIRSSGVNITAITAPLNAEGFRSTRENETSITLQWLHTKRTVSYIVQYDGMEKNVSAPDETGPVNLTISSLRPGTKYSITLFTVSENIRSSGTSITAVTVPLNPEDFRSIGQNDTSITLQWLHTNRNVSYIIQYDGSEKNINVTDGTGPITLTVPSLSPETKYSFTVFAVFENISSSGVSITAITAPLNAEGFRSTRENETSITLQWLHTKRTVSYIVQYDGTEKNISARDGTGPLNLTVSSLRPGTKYSITLFTVSENIRSSGTSITVVTTPLNPEGFRSRGQNETSITLQWLHTNGTVNYIVQYDGTEKNISAPEGVEPVNLTVSSLSPGTAYLFTLFTVFENIRSRGESIIAVTAPVNPKGFRSTGQNETSITLQWLHSNSTVSYIVQYDGTEKNVSAPEGVGPVNLTVSSLSPGTAYLFTLLAVFENRRSSGESIIAVTALNADFRSIRQNETSITLQWLNTNSTVSYIVQYDGTEKNVSAPEGIGPVNLTISSLSPGTAYSFTLFAVFENIRSKGVSIIAVTAPLNAEGFRLTGQNETSITLQWLHTNSMVSYIVQYDGTEKNVSAPEGIGPVNLTVSSLTPGTAYSFTLFTVFENIRSRGESIIAVTAPGNPEGFRSIGQNETSITLQWHNTNSTVSYIVQYDGTEKIVSGPEGVGPVNLTISALSPGTAYLFTLFAVFENIRSSGVSIIAVTALNADFRSVRQNETSITLQWLNTNSTVSYIVQYDGTEKNVSAPEGIGPVNLTISSLSPGTAYFLTLFAVFENIRSKGVSIIAVTAPLNAEGFRLTGQNETSITLQWLHTNSMVSYIVQYDGTEKNVSAPEGVGPVNLTVSSLTPGTAYSFTLFTVFENIRSRGESIIAVTAPGNPEGFRSIGQNETSITLQWHNTNSTVSYIVQYDGTEKIVSGPEGVGPVNLTISALSPGTAYLFTLFTVFENIRSRGESIIAITALNADFRSIGQNETSITLQWLNTNSTVSYIVQYDGTEKNVSAPEGIGAVNLTISSLSPGTAYLFTLFAVFENIRSKGVSIIAVTAPGNPEGFRSIGQNETSITLQWHNTNSTVSYIVQYDGTEKIISGPEGVGPVNLTISALSPGTAYLFTLFAVFENIRSRGVSIIAVTALNADFRSIRQNETSITLQWLNTNSTVSYIVQYDGTEKNVSAPEGIGPVNHTISSLSPGTAYSFTLFAVFENIRSKGVSIIAVTAPLNAEGFRLTGQNETSITLQWLHTNSMVSYIVQYDGTEKNVSAPEGIGPVNLTVSSLTPGTAYSFTLFTVFENIRSRGESIIAVTAPGNPEGFRSIRQNETSITLQWHNTNSTVSYIVQYDGTEKIVSGPEGVGPVNLTISALSPGTAYLFTLFAVFENIRSSGVSIIAVTALNADFRSIRQNETSITLQWLNTNSTVSYIVQYDGTEKNVSAPEGIGPVNLTISSLSPGTAYFLTLFAVFENIRSKGVSIIAVTAPLNAEGFRLTGQNETSITLQWLHTNSMVSYIVQYDGTEKIVSAPEGVGPVNLTVSSLTPGTAYSFTLFTVFENIRSRGESIIAITALNADFRSIGQNETSITLQWLNTNSTVSYIVQYDGTEKNVSAPEGIGAVNLTISSLSPGTAYLFTLFAVFENIRSKGVSIIAVTAPLNAEGFRSTGQNETSITLQWLHTNSRVSYIVQYDGTEKNVSAPEGVGPVNLTVSSLTPGTAYSFTLFTVFENIRSRGESIIAVTALNADFKSIGQNETSITLQWLNTNGMVSYIVQYDGTEKNVSAPEGIGPVNLTISSLSPGTAYFLTLFAVFENIRSKGVSIIAVTAPLNAEGFRLTGQNETSITLQWLHRNSTVSYIVHFDGTEKNVRAPEGVGPVNLTVSSLTPGTAYSFTLFTVFENIRSRGESIIAITAPLNPEGFRSTGQNETSVTLQWLHTNRNVTYIVQYDGTERDVSAPKGIGLLNLTISSLSPGTKYLFILFSVFGSTRSNGVNIAAVTAPLNADGFRLTGQNETSITLQWIHTNRNVTYIVHYYASETNIIVPDGPGLITLTVPSLNPETKYSFTLFTVFEKIKSSGQSITAVTAPLTPEGFRSTGQNETSITLQWLHTNRNVTYIVQYDGTEINIRAPDETGPVNLTVSHLSPGTTHSFTLFSVFENIRSSGVNITALTAPVNPQNFIMLQRNDTSITLQWEKSHGATTFLLQYGDIKTKIRAPDGAGSVNISVSELAPSTEYTFTLYTLFGNLSSSGVTLTTKTASSEMHVIALRINLKTFHHVSNSDIQFLVKEFLRRYGLSQLVLLKVESVKTED
ncbi:tenascin-X-like [Thalassophryne amazonica]|uniref:tenascin-X-like n=1 Tax=Thalassophryne amazonica TaxID=390379 RepID=UPI001471CEF6|nr:tenascin-X-like [Thalassophryne amazonica]